MPFKSHFVPRSRTGKRVVLIILCLYLIIQWPILQLANRIEPFIFGIPFLYFYLLVIYLAIISVMIYACRRGL